MLDEALRSKLDQIARRRSLVEILAAAVHGLVRFCVAFIVVRAVLGLLTGGGGLLFAFALALAIGAVPSAARGRIRHTRLSAAKYADRLLGLEDRLATAVEKADPNLRPDTVTTWLFADAARCAARLVPEKLVPISLPPAAKWLPLLLAMVVILSLPIFPRGLPFQLGSQVLEKAAGKAEELLALAEQLEELNDPLLQEVIAELRRVGENLRDKKLPAGLAAELVSELEKEMQHSSLSPGDEGLEAGPNLAGLQNLAQRLRTIEDRHGLPQGQRISREALSRYSRNPESGAGLTGERGLPQQGRGNEQQAGERFSGDMEEWDEDGGYPGEDEMGFDYEEDPSGSRSGRSGEGADEEGASALPGESGWGEDEEYMSESLEQAVGSTAGSGPGGGEDGSFTEPPDGEREEAFLSGRWQEDGSLFTAPAPLRSAAGPDEGGSRPRETSTTIYTAGVEGAVDQESIPLAYRLWVKRYFEALEPDSGDNY